MNTVHIGNPSLLLCDGTFLCWQLQCSYNLSEGRIFFWGGKNWISICWDIIVRCPSVWIQSVWTHGAGMPRNPSGTAWILDCIPRSTQFGVFKYQSVPSLWVMTIPSMIPKFPIVQYGQKGAIHQHLAWNCPGVTREEASILAWLLRCGCQHLWYISEPSHAENQVGWGYTIAIYSHLELILYHPIYAIYSHTMGQWVRSPGSDEKYRDIAVTTMYLLCVAIFGGNQLNQPQNFGPFKVGLKN